MGLRICGLMNFSTLCDICSTVQLTKSSKYRILCVHNVRNLRNNPIFSFVSFGFLHDLVLFHIPCYMLRGTLPLPSSFTSTPSYYTYPSCSRCLSAFSPIYSTDGSRPIHFPCTPAMLLKCCLYGLCEYGCMHIFIRNSIEPNMHTPGQKKIVKIVQ